VRCHFEEKIPERTGSRMTDRLQELLRQAKAARESAAIAEGEFQGQWLRVAEVWELLAKEYSKVRLLSRGDKTE
jgi:hypothetical protein